MDSLYTPRQESQQCEAITSRIQGLLDREVEQLHEEFVQENMENMVTVSVRACPSFFDEEVRELHSYKQEPAITVLSPQLRQSLHEVGTRNTREELAKAKKAVVQKTAPELIGHIW